MYIQNIDHNEYDVTDSPEQSHTSLLKIISNKSNHLDYSPFPSRIHALLYILFKCPTSVVSVKFVLASYIISV